MGAGETVTSLLSGAAGGLGGGLTYLGTLAASGDPRAAKDVQEKTENALTYQHRTEAGRNLVGGIGKLAGMIVEKRQNGLGETRERLRSGSVCLLKRQEWSEVWPRLCRRRLPI
jgi:hypothetical protein